MGQLGGAGGVGRVRASIGSVIEVLVVLIGVFGESVFGCYGDVYMTQTAHNTNRINDRAATDCPTATGRLTSTSFRTPFPSSSKTALSTPSNPSLKLDRVDQHEVWNGCSLLNRICDRPSGVFRDRAVHDSTVLVGDDMRPVVDRNTSERHRPTLMPTVTTRHSHGNHLPSSR